MRIGLIGAGRIGMSHADLIARRVPGAELRAVADPRPDAAAALASRYGCAAHSDPARLLADQQLDAVVIAASSSAQADLIAARPARQG